MLPLGIVAATLGYGVFYWAAKLWGGHPVSWAEVFGLARPPAGTPGVGAGVGTGPGGSAFGPGKGKGGKGSAPAGSAGYGSSGGGGKSW